MGDDGRETTEMDPDALRQLLSVEAREPRPTVAMRSDELRGLVEETRESDAREQRFPRGSSEQRPIAMPEAPRATWAPLAVVAALALGAGVIFVITRQLML